MPIITGDALTDLETARATLMGKLVRHQVSYSSPRIGIVSKIVTFSEHTGHADSRNGPRLVITFGPEDGPHIVWLDQGTWEVWDGQG